MNTGLTFGEYLRRLRRAKRMELQDVARATGLSLSHLSRLENDHALPTPETVVKLATALDGNLENMLELADCLPREILERLIDRAAGGNQAHHRFAGAPRTDPTFAEALVDEIDPRLRIMLAQAFGLEDRDVDGMFSVLQKLARMNPTEREAVISFLTSSPLEGNS
ncbi:MAG: helix-turn-helix transcriptional regulator [Chloroflexi bacterium]|nr:helix-turn-helix transcriptional regulator [Chloroflexota bacterium]